MTSEEEHRMRPAAVAGLFYPDDTGQLCHQLDNFLHANSQPTGDCPKALIVPHAGYVYSGAIAGSAYSLLQPVAEQITKVVLLGPCHYVPVNYLALPEAEYFQTPLGHVELDRDLIWKIESLPQVIRSAETHAREHALEVQLPFLQRLLRNFTLLPLVVGQVSPEQVCEVLVCVWGGPETLILVSSDLSHYLDYETALKVDKSTSRSIVQLDDHIRPEQACGCYSVNGLLRVARQKNLSSRCIDLGNSGDTSGDRDRVVGYGAYAFYY